VRGLTLFHKRDGSPLSYTTMYGHWRKACQAAGVEGANFHDIRAAAATDARAAGGDSQTLLGHTTESSHRRYLRSKVVPVAQPLPARK
jgi:integrase